MAERSYRFLWQPKWLAGHLLVLAAIVSMILLGRWQLLVSDRKHFNLQNFGYALQWWAFTIFTFGFWIKVLRDHHSGRGSEASQPVEAAAAAAPPVAYRRYVMPTRPDTDSDPALASYNAYLSSLAEPPAPTTQDGR